MLWHDQGIVKWFSWQKMWLCWWMIFSLLCLLEKPSLLLLLTILLLKRVSISLTSTWVNKAKHDIRKKQDRWPMRSSNYVASFLLMKYDHQHPSKLLLRYKHKFSCDALKQFVKVITFFGFVVPFTKA